MNQQQIERDAYYHASEAQKRTIKRLRREGWDIIGSANQAEAVFMIRLPAGDQCRVERDGSVSE